MVARTVVEGIVEEGDQRGREMGFPTANLRLASGDVCRDGVWAGLVHLIDEAPQTHGFVTPLRGSSTSGWVAAISIGRRPTFYGRDGVRLLEAHLLGFSGDLYGRRIRVELAEHLRPMRRFASIAELDRQIAEDVAATRAWSLSKSPAYA